jgi:hypothetical protein
MKASRGCEHLKALAVGYGKPNHDAAALSQEGAEGVKNLMRGAAV